MSPLPPEIPTTTRPLLTLTDAQARRLKPIEGKPDGSLVIHEIYRSLQGESLYAGLPCIFVRLTACHLRCVYCDTPHSFNQGKAVVLDEIIGRVDELGDGLVEITGGEPLLQPEVFELMTRLCDAGKTVLLETSGGVSIAEVDPRVHVILDVKTPGSGEEAANLAENYAILKPDDELKYVLCGRDDFDWAVRHVRQHGLIERCPVTFSPAFGSVAPAELAGWILELRLPIRLQLQLQKQLWDPSARGV